MSAAAGLAAAKRRRGNTVRNMPRTLLPVTDEEERKEPELVAPHTLLLRHDRHIHYLNTAIEDLYGVVDNIHVENQITDNTASFVKYEKHISQLTSNFRTLASSYEQQYKEVEQLKIIISKMVDEVNHHSTQLSQIPESSTDGVMEEGEDH